MFVPLGGLIPLILPIGYDCCYFLYYRYHNYIYYHHHYTTTANTTTIVFPIVEIYCIYFSVFRSQPSGHLPCLCKAPAIGMVSLGSSLISIGLSKIQNESIFGKLSFSMKLIHRYFIIINHYLLNSEEVLMRLETYDYS